MKLPNGDDKQGIAPESQWIINLPEERHLGNSIQLQHRKR